MTSMDRIGYVEILQGIGKNIAMIEQTLREAKQKMEQVFGALGDKLKTLHVGRASSSLVENIMVEHYGTTTPIKQLGSIAVPEPTQIVISPWDKGVLSAIETAVRQSDLGVNPVNDGQAIRIVLPPLSEERRRELAKIVGQMAEEARIALRNARHEAWEAIQAAQKQGAITEDDRERGRKELDKLIETMNGQVETIADDKNKELMSI